jgi:3-oxoacyl-[acyl-carrier-protein] synthase III
VPAGVESATEWDLVDGAMAQAMRRARVQAEELDCIIHISPTIAAPTSSATVGFQDTMRRFQSKYAIRPDCGLYHLHNGCDGVLPALYLADSLIRSGQCRRVLIVTSVCGESLRHVFTSVLDGNDMNAWISALLFGDAATALVLDASADGLSGGDTYFEVDGLMRVTDAQLWIARYEQVTTAAPYLTINPMAAKMLFVNKLKEILGRIDSPIEELDGIVMHQPNSKLVQLINRTVLKGQGYSVVDVANKYGNLVCSSAITNLCEALAAEEAEGRVVPDGAKTLLFTLGADVGMTYGGCMLTRYTKPVN